MIHWAWMLVAFTVGAWAGMFCYALIRANNPDFGEDDVFDGDILVRDPEDPRRLSRIRPNGEMYLSIDGGDTWRLYAYLPDLEARAKKEEAEEVDAGDQLSITP